MPMDMPPFNYAIAEYPIAPATLYNVGGPARIALLPSDETEMVEAYAWMLAQQGPKLILGGGSNVLIADTGFPGIVLFTNKLTRRQHLDNHRYFIGSGVDLDALVHDPMLKNNYDGVGGLTGIPGSVGGAIYMNAGTVNGSTCQLMESVEILTPNGQKKIPMTPQRYSYRGQTFCAPGDAILGGIFQFQPAQEDQRAIYEHYLERRRKTQPQGNSCGSVFKNPPNNHAGKLIEACGLKGTKQGGATISETHANFIVNENNATFDDIYTLITQAKETVQDKFGILLEEEVQILR